MRDECEHGTLRRKCPVCERDEEIDELRAEVARLREERADLREKFWRELYDLPNPTEIMKRFDRAALAGEGVPE